MKERGIIMPGMPRKNKEDVHKEGTSRSRSRSRSPIRKGVDAMECKEKVALGETVLGTSTRRSGRRRESSEETKKTTQKKTPYALELNKENLPLLKDCASSGLEQALEETKASKGGESLLDGINIMRGYVQLHEGSSEQIDNLLKSPYTFKSQISTHNLAENKVQSVGDYDDVKMVLGELEKVIDKKDILQFITSLTYQKFIDKIDNLPDDKKLDDKQKKQLWGLSQLWYLEMARRRGSGGVMNAISATIELAKDDDEVDVNNVLIDMNPMQPTDASGKSKIKPLGKGNRYSRAQQILKKLLSNNSLPNPPLKEVKDKLKAFCRVIDFEKAKQKWTEKKLPGSFDEKTDLHINRDYNILESLGLHNSEEYKELVKAFEGFMDNYYTNIGQPEERIADESKDTDESIDIDHPAIVHLINRAASEGHQKSLDKERDINSIPVGDLVGLFDKNQDPNTATAKKHVAILRQMYENRDKYPIMAGIKLADSPSSFVVENIGKYQDMISDDPEAGKAPLSFFDRLDNDEKKAIKEAMESKTDAQFDSTMEGVPGGTTMQNKTRALWKLFYMVETARNPEAGAINIILAEEGFKDEKDEEGEQKSDLSFSEVYQKFNIMSPVGAPTSVEKREKQYDGLMRSKLIFDGEVAQKFKELKLDSDEDQKGSFITFMKNYFIRRLHSDGSIPMETDEIE